MQEPAACLCRIQLPPLSQVEGAGLFEPINFALDHKMGSELSEPNLPHMKAPVEGRGSFGRPGLRQAYCPRDPANCTFVFVVLACRFILQLAKAHQASMNDL